MTPLRQEIEQRLTQLLAALPARDFCVAFSGGVDSLVLLQVMQQLAQAKRFRDWRLRAVHVHHHLQPVADDWVRAGRRECRRLGLPFTVRHVEVSQAPGTSLEAAAREARLAALASVLRRDEVLLTAHHLDDQLETMLLQLLRGAGVEGLAAMPAAMPFARGWMLRPMLGISRQRIEHWAREQQLTWVEDPSNGDERFDRNYLRHRVLPALRARWPAAAQVAARSAGHLSDARLVLAERAAEDLSLVAPTDSLCLRALAVLSAARQRQVLRAWLAREGLALPDSRHLERIRVELPAARVDARPRVAWAGNEVRRYRQRLYALPQTSPQPARPPAVLRWSWRRARTLTLGPGQGRLRLVTDPHGPIIAATLPATLEVRWRGGGERLALHPGGPRQTLKELLRSREVLPWRREAIPLLFAADRLLAVAGVCVAAVSVAPSSAPTASPAGSKVVVGRNLRFRLDWLDGPSLFA